MHQFVVDFVFELNLKKLIDGYFSQVDKEIEKHINISNLVLSGAY